MGQSQQISALKNVIFLSKLQRPFYLHNQSLFIKLKGGYCPGERLEFQVTLNNQSNRQVKPMVVELNQLITFKASNKSKQEKRSVTKSNYFKAIDENTNEVWSDGSLVK